MDNKTNPQIKTFDRIIPMIYAYNTPGYPKHDGWTKIGYTEKQTVEQRINQQAQTIDVDWELCWKDNAMYKDGSGEYFTDHDFHAYLEVEQQVERTPKTEWFRIDGDTSRKYFDRFASRELSVDHQHKSEYSLRDEQRQAVEMTKAYYENGGEEFLWNAKPRFGKTLTSYDLIRQMGFKKVLIVTNRPSIANSWADDFSKFIAWREESAFVSDTPALNGKKGVYSREEFIKIQLKNPEKNLGMVAFESLQGLKGSVWFGGTHDKLEWMAKEYKDEQGKKVKGMEFDLLIIDEAQEGVDTMRTDRAFRNISRKHTLYLSGTPFKQLASEQFAKEQIFNWSYADEQERKENWDGDEFNPYESLPKLSMFTYQLSPMIRDRIETKADLSDEDNWDDYAFDLNEFFLTNESGKFIHEGEIKKFLHALVTQEKYPFSTPELRDELPHTLWLLNRVASAKALAKLLSDDEVFKEYHVELAAGDGRLDLDDNVDIEKNEKAFDRVKDAISKYDKTITLSVGQLTVGVTIPEWCGVLILCNMKSPSSYMQAAFRAQNPCKMKLGGKLQRKETAYVFDFDPARTLIIFDEFANNLNADTVGGKGTSDDRKDNIRRLLNFFPVLGEDSEGKMVELDAASVLSIPRALKSQEVVRHGFMSNFLFKNISNVFGAPGIVREIVEKLVPAQEEKTKRNDAKLDGMNDIQVNDEGEVEVPNEIVIGKTTDLFGEKVYNTAIEALGAGVLRVAEGTEKSDIDSRFDNLVKSVQDEVKNTFAAPIFEDYEVKGGMRNRLEKQIEKEIESSFEEIKADYEQQTNIARIEFERRRDTAESEEELKRAEVAFTINMDEALKSFTEAAQEKVQEAVKETPEDLVERIEKNKAEKEKKSVEDEVRAHLRGFARTIPSFIMAYGDENLTLKNFDDYTEDDVFLEVTGIPEEDFRFLRDGGEYENPETGEMEHFDGGLFDEVVFNDSIQEFLKKKEELADYFDEEQEEDIFDYIPPQKTNQIFTPKWVVEKMVDELEAENPGCFDDPDKTFADLYMKSGLYITEIVKRLYRSEGMKKAYPDDSERIRHIIKNQVYGMAPSRIIYLIATNYILGFDNDLKDEIENGLHHFVEADAAEAAKAGTLQQLVDEKFA